MPTAKKMPNGRWKCRVYSHTEVIDGKRIARTKSFTADTKHEAEKLASDWECGKEPAGKESVKECLERYLEAKKPALSPCTIKTYTTTIRNSYKRIENAPISACKKNLLQAWVNDRAKSVTPKTIKNEYALLSAACEYCGHDIPKVILPKQKPVEYHLPTDEELQKMLEYCREKCKEMATVIMLSSCGTLRRSEICALHYEDIKGTTAFVHRALVVGYGGTVEKETKTAQSTRHVDLPQFVIDEIGEGTGRIVKMHPNAISKKFIQIREKLGLSHFRLHDLRHYSASRMAALGIPKHYIAERGGWLPGSKVLDSAYINTIDAERQRFEDKTNDYFEKFK